MRVGGNAYQLKRLLFPVLLAACADAPPEVQRLGCSTAFAFRGPGPDESLFLATAMEDSPTVASDTAPPMNDAQLFVVQRVPWALEMVRSDSGVTGSPPSFVPVPGDTILAVPWAHDERCQPAPWDGSAWVPAGEDAVFRVSDARFHRGRLVFDVLGWHGPYPHGDSLAAVASRTVGDSVAWLDAEEFMDLSMALRDVDPTEGRTDQLLAVESVFRGGLTHWLDRFPGPEIVRRAREWAAGSTGAGG